MIYFVKILLSYQAVQKNNINYFILILLFSDPLSIQKEVYFSFKFYCRMLIDAYIKWLKKKNESL